MPQPERPTRQSESPPASPSGRWDVGTLSQALDREPDLVRDVAYGNGLRYQLGQDRPLIVEFFPPDGTRHSGIVRLTGADSRQEFFRQPAPTIRPEGVVFETAEQLISLSPSGDVMTFRTDQPSENPTQASGAGVRVASPAPVAEQPQNREALQKGRIEGNIATKPIFKVTSQQQREITTCLVAEHYTDAEGTEQTIFHRIAAFNKGDKRLADTLRDNAHIGDKLIAHGAWHEVPIRYQNGKTEMERQLWAYGLKITPKNLPASPRR